MVKDDSNTESEKRTSRKRCKVPFGAMLFADLNDSHLGFVKGVPEFLQTNGKFVAEQLPDHRDLFAILMCKSNI